MSPWTRIIRPHVRAYSRSNILISKVVLNETKFSLIICNSKSPFFSFFAFVFLIFPPLSAKILRPFAEVTLLYLQKITPSFTKVAHLFENAMFLFAKSSYEKMEIYFEYFN